MLWRRLGVDRESLKGPPGDEAGSKREHGLEERVLQLLLGTSNAVPPLDDLPPPEAFLGADCRNIFRVFSDLYKENGEPPEARAVRDALGDENEAVDQLARILLEVSAPSRENELPEAMRSIRRRWQQQRLRELSAELEQAQRQGDDARLERILEERTALSAELHRSRTQT
jgi:replicative DNA helicase